jgi:hypothetical protein
MRKLNLVVVEQLQEILEIGFQFHASALGLNSSASPEIDIELPVWKPAPDNPAHGGRRAHAASLRTEGIRQTAPI